MLSIVAMFTVIVMPGCANLKDKAVVMGGSVQGLKVTMDIDQSSGSPTPFPKVSTGFFNFFWIDIPVDNENELEYFQQDKSIWNQVPATTYYVRIRGSTKNGDLGRVKLSSSPMKLIDTPVLMLSNPFQSNAMNIEVTPPTGAAVDTGVKVDTGTKITLDQVPLLISKPSTDVKVDTGVSVDTKR